jgi:hypothetical protein
MPAPSEPAERLRPSSALALFSAGCAFLMLCSAHRFTTALHYAYLGGFEIIHGRLPYRDFSFLTGPAMIFLQALWFKVTGTTSYLWGYATHAAVLNGLAAVMVAGLAVERTGRERVSLAAGALTSVWFYSVFMAVPWYDHEAHFFLIAALWLMRRSQNGGGRFAAGLLASTSFFCKQSHGAFGLIFLCLYLFVSEGWGAAAAFTAGGTAGVAAWSLGCASIAGWAPFYHDFLYLPLHSGRVSFTHEARFWVLSLPAMLVLLVAPSLKPYRVFAPAVALSAAAIVLQSPLYLVFLAPLALWPWLETVEERALTLALVLIQLDGRLTSNNEIKIYWPFLGVFFALAYRTMDRATARALQSRALQRAKPVSEFVLRRCLWSCWLFMMLWGIRLSYLHKVNSPFPGSTFLAALLFLALAFCLRPERRLWRFTAGFLLISCGLLTRSEWAYLRHLRDPVFMAGYDATKPSRTIDEPVLRGVTMTEGDARGLEAALPALRALPPERKPVFSYCECDILYPLINQPLPPFWWFDPTSTFKPGDGTEEKVISFLEKDHYGTFIWCPVYSSLMEMPKLEQWLKDHTKFEHDYAGYRFYEIEKTHR